MVIAGGKLFTQLVPAIMELFLNILWVLMAAGVLWTWRARWVHQRKRTLRHSLQEWTAVSVALILLFFAVSMTDDLHADLVLFDECSTSRRGSSLLVDAHQPSLHSGTTLHGASPAIVPSLSPFRVPLVVRSAVFVAESFEVPLGTGPITGRAPPSLAFNS